MVSSGVARCGFWVFRNRGWIPVPIYAALIVCTHSEVEAHGWLWPVGGALIMAGHGFRIWATRYIGRSARTRGAKSARLVTDGPYAYVRNPLYIANVSIGCGFALLSELVWAVPIVLMLGAVYYSLIVRWEEELLTAMWGEAYRHYAQVVPRWIPLTWRREIARAPYSLPHAIYRDRRTLTATCVMVAALLTKEMIH